MGITVRLHCPNATLLFSHLQHDARREWARAQERNRTHLNPRHVSLVSLLVGCNILLFHAAISKKHTFRMLVHPPACAHIVNIVCAASWATNEFTAAILYHSWSHGKYAAETAALAAAYIIFYVLSYQTWLALSSKCMFYDAGVIKFLAFCMPSNYGAHKKRGDG
jgi:hypothetical protein